MLLFAGAAEELRSLAGDLRAALRSRSTAERSGECVGGSCSSPCASACCLSGRCGVAVCVDVASGVGEVSSGKVMLQGVVLVKEEFKSSRVARQACKAPIIRAVYPRFLLLLLAATPVTRRCPEFYPAAPPWAAGRQHNGRRPGNGRAQPDCKRARAESAGRSAGLARRRATGRRAGAATRRWHRSGSRAA